MAVVSIPTPLRPHTGGHAQVEAQGATVGEVLADLGTALPRLPRADLRRAGELQQFVNVYVNNEDIRFLDDLATAVADQDESASSPPSPGAESPRLASHKANPCPSNRMAVDPLDRYSRQIRFHGLGEAGQRRLLASRVTLCGCGALGTVLANHLVRAGVGHVRIVDRDFIETHNLQRQVLFDEQDVADNLPKAEAAARKLRADQLRRSTSSRSSPTSTTPTSSTWSATPT